MADSAPTPPDLDERLARLSARRSATSPPADTPQRAPARRGHPAAAARVLAAGLSSSACLSIVAALGAHARTSTPARPVAAAPPRAPVSTPPTTIVVKTVHHTLLVDRYGRPVTLASLRAAAQNSQTSNTRARLRTVASSPTPANATTTAPAPSAPPVTSPPATAPPPPPPPPACTATKCP